MADSAQKEIQLSYKIVKADIDATRNAIKGLAADIKAVDTAGNGFRVVGNGLKNFSAQATAARNEMLKGTRAIQEQETVLERYRKKLSEVNQEQSHGGGGATLGKGLSIVGAIGNATGLGGEISQIGSIAQQAAPLVQGLGASMGEIAIASPLAAAAMIAITVAAKKFTEELEKDKQRLSDAIEGQKTYYELIATGTTETVKAGLEELKIKQAIAAQTRRDIQAGIDAAKQQYGIFGDLVVWLGGIGDEAKKADQELNKVNAEMDAYNRALESSAVAANDAKKREEELAKARREQTQQGIEDVKRYNADVARISQQEQDQLAAAAKRYADNQVRIAQQAADASEQALSRLQDARARLQTEAIRADEQATLEARRRQLDGQIVFQRQETLLARQHANDLLEIQRRADDQEFDLALNRDFAGITQLRRNTANQMRDANLQANEEQAQRLETYKQKLEDDQAQFIREREDRIARFKQQLADANAQYRRELQLIAQNKSKQLELLAQAYSAEQQMIRAAITAQLEARRQGLIAELQLVYESSRMRLQAEAQLIQQLNGYLRQAGIIVSGGTTTTTNNVTMNISGSNPEATARATEVRLARVYEALGG